MIKNIETVKVTHWTKQIDRCLDNKKKYGWAFDTLKRLRANIEKNDHITDNQIQLIKNIKNGKRF
jgi:hypothetical protein